MQQNGMGWGSGEGDNMDGILPELEVTLLLSSSSSQQFGHQDSGAEEVVAI